MSRGLHAVKTDQATIEERCPHCKAIAHLVGNRDRPLRIRLKLPGSGRHESELQASADRTSDLGRGIEAEGHAVIEALAGMQVPGHEVLHGETDLDGVGGGIDRNADSGGVGTDGGREQRNQSDDTDDSTHGFLLSTRLRRAWWLCTSYVNFL